MPLYIQEVPATQNMLNAEKIQQQKTHYLLYKPTPPSTKTANRQYTHTKAMNLDTFELSHGLDKNSEDAGPFFFLFAGLHQAVEFSQPFLFVPFQPLPV